MPWWDGWLLILSGMDGGDEQYAYATRNFRFQSLRKLSKKT